MGETLRWSVVVTMFAGWTSVASAANPSKTPELDAERDALIAKITRGVELEASVQRFRTLVQERDKLIATSKAAVEQQRAIELERRTTREAYHKTVDYDAGWRCTLSVDPAHPAPSDESRMRADWGRVVRKEEVRLQPKNDLDEGELVTAYEIAGLARNYIIVVDAIAKRDPKYLQAAKGDLVFVCDGGTEKKPRLTGAWAQLPAQRNGVAAKIAAVPAITKKGKWNPRHITQSRFYWAIHDVKWKYAPEEFMLANVELAADLGDGRWKINANNDTDWVMEVPAGLKNRNVLAPGKTVWVILGQQRFDKTLRKLVLVAQDIEERYVVEK